MKVELKNIKNIKDGAVIVSEFEDADGVFCIVSKSGENDVEMLHPKKIILPLKALMQIVEVVMESGANA